MITLGGSRQSNINDGTKQVFKKEVFLYNAESISTVKKAPFVDFSFTDTCFNSNTQFTLIFSSADSVKWDFGDGGSGALNFSTSINPQHIYSGNGTYYAQCIVFSAGSPDTALNLITIIPLPVFDLGANDTICNGTSVTLDASSSPTATYLWQNGSTNATWSANITMTYSVTVTDKGCFASDSVHVDVLPPLQIFPSTDTTICIGSQIFLDITNIASGFSFQWSDGYALPYRFIATDGIYTATVTVRNCTTTSTYILRTLNKPTLYLGEDTVLCKGGGRLLDASYAAAVYIWQDGSTSPTLTAATTNTYAVQVSNQCGIVADSINLEFVDCNCNIFFPKAFTPNSDGRNEYYNYKYDCLDFKSQLRIFNRWGTLVFTSEDPLIGWDGKFKGNEAVAEAYIYVLKYTGVIDGKIKDEIKRGMFVLYR